MAQSSEDVFTTRVRQLRAKYEQERNSTNLVSPTGRPVIDLDVEVIDGVAHHMYWYEDNADGYCVRLADLPGTLSGDILRLQRNLPAVDGSYEVIGNEIRRLEHALPLPEFDDDSEELGDLLASLPEVEVNDAIHFVKKGKYRSEISNLLECQGGFCPGQPISPHVIQLLGRTADGKLVFEKFKPRWHLAHVHALADYKRWILQVISGLKCLHSQGIVHRDLRIDNMVFTADMSRLVLIDLESRWGNRRAPEITQQPVLDAGWTEQSDIFDLGYVIQGMIYGNAPITNLVAWPVPPPLEAVVEACSRELPEERPSLDELYTMVDSIEA